MTIIVLAVLGLIFGSFVNALVWRVKNDRNFISERSECTHCGQELAIKDLIPVISYLSLKGRCRYCGKEIEDKPWVEIVTALVFAISYLFWPADLSQNGPLLLFIAWLLSAVGLIALAVYDLRWMLLPNKILYPTLLIAGTGYFLYWLFFANDKEFFLINWALSVLVASGVFLALYIVSAGKWIGFGDVRLGLVTGTLLHKPGLAVLMIFVSAVLGSLAFLPTLITKQKTMRAKIPYGPFLIAATGISMLFGQTILEWYTNNLVI